MIPQNITIKILNICLKCKILNFYSKNVKVQGKYSLS